MRLVLCAALIAWPGLSVRAAEPDARASAPAGSDWPCFLGPTGDSKSSERGILAEWPAEGPPLVWQLELGTGYCMPVVAAGRLYQFDRIGGRERLRSLDEAESVIRTYAPVSA